MMGYSRVPEPPARIMPFMSFYALCNGAETLTLIAATLHAAAPSQIIQIPLNRLANAGQEGFLRRPTEIVLDFAGIDGVAQVMAWAVLDVGDEVFVAAQVLGE